MKKRPVKQFFDNINIKYADNPYLYIPLMVILLLTLGAWFIWGDVAILWSILGLSTYLILATQFHLYRTIRIDMEQQQRKMQAYFTLYSLGEFRRSLPYMTGWAATPELAVVTFEEICKNKPEHIVELGSGISTIVAAYGLEKNGTGSILSLDHDKSYAAKTRKQIEEHGMSGIARIFHTPLIPYQIKQSSWEWYDLNSAALPETIDMMLIDGPPVKTNHNARYPALPLLYDRMSEKGVIILHDAHRPNEQDTLRQWQEAYPDLDCEVLNTEKGIAILRKKPTSQG